MSLGGNLVLLSACQALLLTNAVTLVAVTGLVGTQLAPIKALATFPLTTFIIGSAVSTIPASLYMRRRGRRAGFTVGATMGVLGSLVCAAGVWLASFPILALGTLLLGIYNAFGQYYRFAAADLATPAMKSRAISWTLAGGIAGGVLGPEVSKFTRHLLDTAYVGSYLALAVFALAALALVSRITTHPTSDEERAGSGRTLAQITRQPVFIVAVCGAIVGYGVMNLLMNATPIAMDMCGLTYDDTALVLQWHVIGMFGPSFVTGSLIARFGVLKIMGAGCSLMLVCATIGLAGISLMHFWWALLLLGVGWNFLFVGGTTLLTEAYAPSEKAKTQGVNDFLVFFTTAMTSLASGALVTATGWATLNQVALPLLALCAGALWWLSRIRATAAA